MDKWDKLDMKVHREDLTYMDQQVVDKLLRKQQLDTNKMEWVGVDNTIDQEVMIWEDIKEEIHDYWLNFINIDNNE